MAHSYDLTQSTIRLVGNKGSRAVERIQRKQIKNINLLIWYYVNNQKRVRMGLFMAVALFFTRQSYKLYSALTRVGDSTVKNTEKGQTSSKFKSDMNKEFLDNFKKILAIIIPGVFTKEFGTLIIHSMLLVARTVISVMVASLDGEIVSSMVRLKFKEFFKGIGKWMLLSIPATITNSSLEYLKQSLSIQFNKRLNNKIYETYLKGNTFYALSNLDNRVKNADQVIVVDVQKLCNSLALLYSNMAKPTLDCLVYNIELAKRVGFESLFAVSMVIQLSAAVLRTITPPFGTLVVQEQKLEGDLHHAHSRVIEYSEEIALFRGHVFERNVIQKKYKRLIKHINRVFKLHVFYGMIEDFVIKYFWGAAGLVTCAVPVFAERIPPVEQMKTLMESDELVFMRKVESTAEDVLGMRTRDFVINRRLLLSASDALGRIISSYKEIVQLAGYTKRVSDLLDVLEEVSQNKFVRDKIAGSSLAEQDSLNVSRRLEKMELREAGKVVECDYIAFKKVPILSPNGDVLISSISFAVLPGMNLLVVGPNGCGKSSMFRILGGLWPVYGGTLYRPPSSNIFYLPQRPYMCAGTLRDQIIYPHSILEMKKNKVTDSDLDRILRVVELGSLVAKEGGWNSVKEWRDYLSSGDKQKIAMARLFYHKPKYAIMDECTSSVSLEIEEIMYTHAAKLNITMLTVSHRQSLWRYHNYILEFDGQGNYYFSKFDPEKRLGLLAEMQKLDMQTKLYKSLDEKLGSLKPESSSLTDA